MDDDIEIKPELDDYPSPDLDAYDVMIDDKLMEDNDDAN